MAIQVILTDIEGTTSSISFVHDVLFPYAAKHLPDFVRRHRSEAAVAAALAATCRDAGLADGDVEGAIRTLLAWIAEDRKATPLKDLQGLVWKDGYASGAYRAHVYPEVSARLAGWRALGLKLYVYSSGSIAAQKLLFGHSEAGDLTPLFSGYFDTTSGGKREAQSYRNITAAIGVAAPEILFLSDIEAELDAARAAGMKTTWLRRDLSTLPESSSHPVALNFDQIDT